MWDFLDVIRSGQPEMILSARAWISTPISKASSKASFRQGTDEHGGWWYPIQSHGQVYAWGVRVYLGWPFPYQGSNGVCIHFLAGIGAYIVAGLVYLQGFSGWLTPVLVVRFNGEGSTIDINPEPFSSEDGS